MEPQLELHWYPGHMAKAKRELKTRWRLVDVVLEVLDARLPSTSRHPQPVAHAAPRPRVLLLGKEDLAEPRATARWLGHFRGKGLPALAADLRTGGWVRPLRNLLRRAGRSRGGRSAGGRGVRVLVVGLPNVGKSTAINSLAARGKAETGGSPGVTRGLQWLAGGAGLQLLDSPGVLWPGATRGWPALFLAAAGCVPDGNFDVHGAADDLLRYLLRHAPSPVRDRYGDGPWAEADDLVEEVARRRGMLRAGGVPDAERAAAAVLHDFRTGRLGRITFEGPPRESAAGDGGPDGD